MTIAYEPLTPDSLPRRLAGVAPIRARLGDPSGWRVREVGDGNLNLVFIVEGPSGSVVVKQALPYVRLVGDSWPLPLNRSFFEYHALTRQAARDPGSVPEVFHFDEGQAIIAMEFLSDHIILRRGLIEGRQYPGLGQRLGLFCARTLFRGSDLSMTAAARKGDVALFAGNVALCDITESLVFTDPYFDAPLNRHTPGLEAMVAILRADLSLKVAAQDLKMAFASRAETMLHGDLHTGSVMVSDRDIRVIDPEFATYGPIGFDVGMLIANFLMAALSQPGHAERPGTRDAHAEWILGEAELIWATFRDEFARLWRAERTGMLYPASLYEAQGHGVAAEMALAGVLAGVWRDAIGFCGVEIHRRILGLAHNADFERIVDEPTRAACEARALALGRVLVLGAGGIADMAQVTALTRLDMTAG
jgi:5-methylthioribose kinase